ncbi:MAG: hypothetical protein WDN10_02760 [bacterium]
MAGTLDCFVRLVELDTCVRELAQRKRANNRISISDLDDVLLALAEARETIQDDAYDEMARRRAITTADIMQFAKD